MNGHGTPRRTVLLCCNSLWGLVNFRGRVIRALADDGHRVVLVAVPDIPVQRALDLGAEFVEWRVAPRGANPLRELVALAELVRLYGSIRPDIAFHFTVKPVLYGALAARLAGAQAVAVVTGLGYLFLTPGLMQSTARWFYRAMLGSSREVWFLNSEDRAVFENAGLTRGLKVQTLPGEGIDLRHFGWQPLPPVDGDFVFLMIARLLRDKGVVEFAEAAREVRRRYPRARFRLLGPSYQANEMSVPLETVRAWESEGTIEYLGAADDVRPAIAACHCVVLPSYREGMPRVLMEASAMGRPSIATDVVGCRDVVQPGLNGWLCLPRDAHSLAQACIVAMETSRDDLLRMAQQARELAHQTFDDETIIQRYRNLVAHR